MTDAERASAESAIRRVIAAYCHSCDEGRFADYAQLFAPDATVVLPGQEVTGRAAIQAWITAGQPPHKRGMHVTTNVELDVVEGRARGRTGFLFLAHGTSGLQVSTAGRYLDEFVRDGGSWLIARREITFLRPGGS